jgi:hypothetical protein
MKETVGKFIIQLTGPAVKYRLDILAKVCPELRHFLICLTNKESYELYKEYHNFFEFVIMDDYRSEYPISLEYETFPNYKTEDEFFAKVGTFYGSKTNRFYPYDIHRFIFPYLIENNILNFAISDTDFIVKNDFELLNKFFKSIPEGTMYGPWHGQDSSSLELKNKFWKDVQEFFPTIELNAPFIRTQDGWMRGFHFKNKEDMKLLYDIWNKSLDTLFENQEYRQILVGHNGAVCQTEWVISYIIQFFEHQKKYSYVNCEKLLQVDNMTIGRHYTRVEDTLYLGKREVWNYLNFDYSDVSNISNFIKNNKEQLYRYYDGTFKVEVTDTHVYTQF